MALNLNLTDREILANLTVLPSHSNDPTTIQAAKALQQEHAATLADDFENGAPLAGVPLDKWKARKYRTKSGKKPANSTTDAPGSKIINTENIYWGLGYYTSVRLFLVRFNRVLKLAAGRSFLPSLFSIGGLSYGIELLIDLTIIGIALFRPPQSEAEQQIPVMKRTWLRFKAVMTKDNRIVRMVNAALWFGINLAAFILTGGLSSILNIAGFGGDVGIELYKAAVIYTQHTSLIRKLTREIKAQIELKDVTDKELNQLNTTIDSDTASYKKKLDDYNRLKKAFETSHNKVSAPDPTNNTLIDQKTTALDPTDLNKIRDELSQDYEKLIDLNTQRNKLLLKKMSVTQEIARLELLKTATKQERKSKLLWQLYPIAVTVAILVGMALIFFPPTTWAGVSVLVGACISLGAGSVFFGLGRRLFNKGKELAGKLITRVTSKSDIAPKLESTSPLPQPVNAPANQSPQPTLLGIDKPPQTIYIARPLSLSANDAPVQTHSGKKKVAPNDEQIPTRDRLHPGQPKKPCFLLSKSRLSTFASHPNNTVKTTVSQDNFNIISANP